MKFFKSDELLRCFSAASVTKMEPLKWPKHGLSIRQQTEILSSHIVPQLSLQISFHRPCTHRHWYRGFLHRRQRSKYLRQSRFRYCSTALLERYVQTYSNWSSHQTFLDAAIQAGFSFRDEGELVASCRRNEPGLLCRLPHQSALWTFPAIGMRQDVMDFPSIPYITPNARMNFLNVLFGACFQILQEVR